MPNNKIYINNLDKSVTETLLKEQFSEHGDITNIVLPQNKKHRNTKGYAFITYTTGSAAQDALKQDGTLFLEKEITVEIATEKRSKD